MTMIDKLFIISSVLVFAGILMSVGMMAYAVLPDSFKEKIKNYHNEQ